jgi:NAD(P)-dependent dehydrogenase (short-subunit alcohol dehydrogenase family)
VLAGRTGGVRGLAEPEDVAARFAFLASDDARMITGAIYTIDNGLTAS